MPPIIDDDYEDEHPSQGNRHRQEDLRKQPELPPGSDAIGVQFWRIIGLALVVGAADRCTEEMVPMRNGMSIPASGTSRAMCAKPPSGWTKSFCISTIISADLSISGPIMVISMCGIEEMQTLLY